MTGSVWQTPASFGARQGWWMRLARSSVYEGVWGGSRAPMWENWSSLASSKVIEILQNFFFFTFYTIFTVNSLVLFGAVLGLCRCTQAFSSCGAGASHRGGCSYCGSRALGAWASVVTAHGLSFPVPCGIFPTQGSNSCPLHWRENS